MSSILIGQSAWVPGLATNPYQQLQNLIYLLDIAVKKIKAGDPEGLGLLGEMPEDVAFGEMLVTQVGGSAPALVNSCAIYAERPQLCRDFKVGGEGCHRAREFMRVADKGPGEVQTRINPPARR